MCPCLSQECLALRLAKGQATENIACKEMYMPAQEIPTC